jgi:hypothetical protein
LSLFRPAISPYRLRPSSSPPGTDPAKWLVPVSPALSG